MFSIRKEDNGVIIDCEINGEKDVICMANYSLISERSEFEIVQEYGLNSDGELSKDFIPFENKSVEAKLIEFVRSGDPEPLIASGMLFCDRPTKGNVSRNIALFDPETGMTYFVGGIGLIMPTDDPSAFMLTDPRIDTKYVEHQKKHNNPIGGTVFFNEEGMQPWGNSSILGTIEYNTGPYHAERKVLETEKLRNLGIHAPRFLAAGPIMSLDDGKFGFTIYASPITPDYLFNRHLFIENNGQFKPAYKIYLKSKYAQLYKMHFEIGESHGQPSLMNTLIEIDLTKTANNVCCQVKDFETNQPIPKSEDITILDGLASVPSGFQVRKSPRAAAMIYDLQLAVLQELNAFFEHARALTEPQKKFEFITQKSAWILLEVCTAYPLIPQEGAKKVIEETMKIFYMALNAETTFKRYNELIGGTFAHLLFAMSEPYHGQVKVERFQAK